MEDKKIYFTVKSYSELQKEWEEKQRTNPHSWGDHINAARHEIEEAERYKKLEYTPESKFSKWDKHFVESYRKKHGHYTEMEVYAGKEYKNEKSLFFYGKRKEEAFKALTQALCNPENAKFIKKANSRINVMRGKDIPIPNEWNDSMFSLEKMKEIMEKLPVPVIFETREEEKKRIIEERLEYSRKVQQMIGADIEVTPFDGGVSITYHGDYGDVNVPSLNLEAFTPEELKAYLDKSPTMAEREFFYSHEKEAERLGFDTEAVWKQFENGRESDLTPGQVHRGITDTLKRMGKAVSTEYVTESEKAVAQLKEAAESIRGFSDPKLREPAIELEKKAVAAKMTGKLPSRVEDSAKEMMKKAASVGQKSVSPNLTTPDKSDAR